MRFRLLEVTTLLILLLVLGACSNASRDTATTAPSPTEIVVEEEGEPEPTATIPPIPTPAPVVEAVEAVGEAEDEAETTDVGSVSAEDAAPNNPPFVVGSKAFTEQLILGSLMVELLRANGYEVVDKVGYGGTTLVREALETGDINLYPEYNGTGLSVHNGIPSAALPADAVRTYELAKTLDEPNGIVWLNMAEFNNTYTMMVRDVLVEQGVGSIDDLRDFINETGADIKLCVEAEFYGRPEDGLQAMLEMYNLDLPEENIIITSTPGAYSELRAGVCDVAEGFATDARIAAWGFTNLEDSRNYFPFYNPAPTMRAELAEQYPEAVELLNTLFESLNGNVMSNLNAQVDLGRDGEFDTGDERSPSEVAVDYLTRAGLLGELPTVNIGTINTQELNFVSALTQQLLEQEGFQTTLTSFESNVAARDALLANEIDLVWDNTAQALTAFHNLPLNALPASSFATYSMIKSLDERYADLTWLQPAGWDNKLVGLVNPNSEASRFTLLDDVLAALASNESAGATVCASPSVANVVRATSEGAFGFSLGSDQLLEMTQDEVYERVRDETCDFGLGRATDPRIPAYGLVRLADPNDRFPATSNAPAIRTLLADQFPNIEDVLADAFTVLDTSSITTQLARITYGPDGVPDSGDEASIDAVAQTYLSRVGSRNEAETIVIGAQGFTEQTILSALTAGILRDLGFNVIERSDVANTEAAYTQITQEQIDLYWTYTGSTLGEIHVLDALPSDPVEAHEMASELDVPVGLTWLNSAEFNDTFALIINPASAPVPLANISDLATYMNENEAPLTLCLDEDFLVRADGLLGLQDRYAFAFAEDSLVVTGGDSLYLGLTDGTCDVAAGLRTDGHIAALALQTLEDDLGLFPAYNAAPIVRSEFADAYPVLEPALNALALTLSEGAITELNASVGIGQDGIENSGDERSIATVTAKYLCSNGLITQGCDAAMVEVANDSIGDLEAESSCEMIDVNGTFEDDRIWSTPITRSSGEYTNVQSHSGDWSMQLGARGRGQLGSYSIAQTLVTLPVEASSAEISFWYLPSSLDVLGGDVAALYIFDETLSFAREIFTYPISGEEAWTQTTFDLTGFRGDPIVLHFLVINDGDGIPTTVFVDDIELVLCFDQEAQ